MMKISDKGLAFIKQIQETRASLATRDEEDCGDPIIFEINPIENPVVSVEVLLYNQAQWLSECIESIVSQQVNFPFEIIIANDCSTDQSLEVAKTLMGKYPHIIRIISTQRNVGLTRNARNARRIMRGKYAAFCEGDDWWCNNTRMQQQVNILERQKDVSCVHGMAKTFYEKSGTYAQEYWRLGKVPNRAINRFSRALDGTYFIHTATAMCRVSDLIRIYKEAPTLIGASCLTLDFQLFILLASYGKFYLIHEPFSVWRISGKSESANQDPLKNFRFYDNAFWASMRLKKYFKCGFLAYSRQKNATMNGQFNKLCACFPRTEAYAMMKILYPNMKIRLMFYRLFPPPKNKFLEKLYFHTIFSVCHYRRAF